MLMRLFVSTLLLIGAPWLAAQDAPQPIAGRYIIDVRSDAEWDKSHIAGAIHIPHTEIGGRIEAVLPDRAAPIGLYCGSGKRAGVALETLKGMGYTELENLGGMEAARVKIEQAQRAR